MNSEEVVFDDFSPWPKFWFNWN